MFKPLTSPRPANRAVERIPIDAIHASPALPRRRVTPESVALLAESIRRHGQLTPLLVCRDGDRCALIAGQRRLQALRLLGRTHAEAVVLDIDECDGALLALVDNMQREPLNYLDAAEACRRILEKQPITRERLAAGLSVSPSALAGRLRLLELPPRVRDILRRSALTERHARALLKLDDPDAQLALAREAADKHMSVRQLEARISARLKPAKPSVSPRVRDNRIIINAVMDTVRELNRIGVNVSSRVEEREDAIDVVVTIPVRPGHPEKT